MSVFMVETYVVKPEKQDALMPLLQKVVKIMKDNPGKFKEVKSYRHFSQTIGNMLGQIEVWELTDMGVIDCLFNKFFTDEELKKIPQEFFASIVPETYNIQIWKQDLEYKV